MSGIAVSILINEREHLPPQGHPENVSRLKLIADELTSRIEKGTLSGLEVSLHGTDPIKRIHDPAYVDWVQQLSAQGVGYLDPDTYVTPKSFGAACAVVDHCLSGVDAIMNDTHSSVFVLGRPPGHHALADHAMGFCIFNNAAIAAQYAIDRHQIGRVAVVDFDVHHGNGTQAIFYERNDVFYCSCHRYPFYPGTGNSDEKGRGQGRGFTLNCPLAAGDGDAEIVAAVRDAFCPALTSFHPDLLIVSAGFDAHRLDPLGGLCVTGDGYRQIGQALRMLAADSCRGKVLSILEGGYDPRGNLESITCYLEGLAVA